MSAWNGFDSIKKIWSGPDFKPNFDVNSVGVKILNSLKILPNKVIQINDNNGVCVTNNEMRLRTIRVAQTLQRMGFEQEDIIGIAGKNSSNLAPLVFGAFLCGIPFNTLDITFKKSDIVHMFGITQPKIIFCDDENYEEVQMAMEKLNLNSPIYILSGEVKGVKTIEDFLQETGTEDEFVVPNLTKGEEQVAIILCSSGTTGLPKGVCLTHSNLINNFPFFEIISDDVLICYSSLYWLSGLGMLLSGTYCGATRILTEEPFDSKMALRMFEKYKVSILFTPPSQLAMILDDPNLSFRHLSSIRLFACGGSMVPNALAEKITKYLKNNEFSVGYGMSEVGGCCSINTSKYSKVGSVGKLINGCHVKIIDENGTPQGINQSGEILIKPTTPFVGYFKNPEATKQLVDNEGWIHSGDIGYMDEEEYLFVIDRKKDIFKYKNYHFYPSEIEEVILEHSGVSVCCVCGIPDPIYTDLPAVAIVKKANSIVTEDSVYNFVAERMSHFKHLRGGVYFLESLPMTASGKVQRKKVQEILTKLHSKRL